MDLSNFKLLKEDASEMHVQHPSGKTLVLDKKAMSDKAKSLVKKMACGGEVKGYDEGGDVDSDKVYGAEDVDAKIEAEKQHAKDVTSQAYSPSTTVDVRTPEQKDRAKAAALTYGYADGGMIGQNSVLAPTDQSGNPVENAMQVNMPQVAPVAQPAPVAQAPQQAQDPMVTSKLSEEDLLNKELKDVGALSQAQQGAAGNVQKAYNDYSDSMEDSVQNPNDLVKDMEAKDKVLGQAFMSNKIDPDRYWNSKSGFSKILSGIAMGLGGIGAPATGGRNLVMDQFNKAVENDIDSQKNEQGKKMTLWKMNREAFGDDMRANLATQNQLYTGLQAKIAKAAAQVQAPEAKFHASQLMDGIEQQKIANRQRLGLLTQGQNDGSGVGSANPLMMATDPNIVPADKQKDVITELGKAKYVADHAAELRQAYQAAEQEQTIAQRAGRLGYEGPAMKNLRLLGAPLLKDNDGRVNENAIKTYEEILPGPLERESTANSKRDAFNKFLKLHSDAPMASAYGLDPNRFAATSTNPMARLPADQKAIYNWAKANPSNPKAAAAMKKFSDMGIK